MHFNFSQYQNINMTVMTWVMVKVGACTIMADIDCLIRIFCLLLFGLPENYQGLSFFGCLI